ncbi:MAG: primosomal protein N' [Oscillospiraceae bacterium]|nr:primosomal protein N' [Oscillospiraceae bacterium]
MSESGFLVAELAVAAAKFHIDKPYFYRVPDSLAGTLVRGLRVAVPFGRANRQSEAVVLGLRRVDDVANYKFIESALEDAPSLTEEQLKLAIWMSERFFCSVFDAVHACLPSGVWYREGKTPVAAKNVRYVTLAVSVEEAREESERKKLRAPTQSAILRILADTDAPMSAAELIRRADAVSGVLRPLEKQGLIRTEELETARRPAVTLQTPDTSGLTLSPEQYSAFYRLDALLKSGAPEAALLYGVTGSGKTSVYLKLIESALELGKSAVVLVPEIALTPQLMSIFFARFGDDVAVLHSALTPGERFDEWRRIRSGGARVAIGTRSAVFAPLSDLGLIIIDEEQESTYKSESSPRYHAREIAKYRCVKANALLVLGSATPSVESMRKAETGAYKLVRLESRYGGVPMPRVIVADMKEELRAGSLAPVGSVLERELRENITRGEQSIVFLNRRGASPVVTCVSCGHTFSCPRCSVHLTYHSSNKRLMCHYCNHSEPVANYCTKCGGKLKFVGAGTQKVEEWLLEKFPGVAVSRMDADTISAVNTHDKVLSEFRERNIPILLGTQMVAKGLDFPNVTLVGVVSADMSLYVNDYRAFERTFSLITQVVGRSGRGSAAGRAVIQTTTPEHDVIRLASRQDYDGFYAAEIARRRAAGLPPERDVISMNLNGEEEERVLLACTEVRAELASKLGGASVLGPAPAPIVKLNNKFRYRVTVMCENSKEVRSVVAGIVRAFPHDAKHRGLGIFANADPFE